MGGKGGRNKTPNAKAGAQPRVSTTMREESSGKKHGHVNAKTMCKLDHLKNLAVWAAAEASVPPLAAFFGERLAATSEALGLRTDTSSFVCERCESILQPGHNCTVRIEKNKVQRRRKKPNPTPQNNVVYKCHFCSHRNLMRGTPNGYIKEICPPKPKPALKQKTVKSAVKKHLTLEKATTAMSEVDFVALPPSDGQNLATAATSEVGLVALPQSDGRNLETGSPATPLAATGLSLLDSKRKKRTRCGVKKVAEPEITGEAEKSVHVSSKRRKKAWTSLKEIAESSGRATDSTLTNLAIPFFI